MAANPNVDQIIASTRRYFAHKSFADQVINGRKTTAWMKKKGAMTTYDGGRVIFEPTMEAHNSTAAFQGSLTEVDFSPQNEFGGAEYTSKIMTASTVLAWKDRWDNSGAAQVINLWKAKLNSTKEGLADLLNTTICTSDGTDALKILGLPIIVAATGSLGGIARSSNSFWQSYVESTAGPLTDDDIRLGAATVTRGLDNNEADLHLTTLALYLKYESMLVPALRFENKTMADLGFPTQSLTWGGAAVTWDNSIAAGEYYFLNTKWFAIRTHSLANFAMTDKLPTKQLIDGLFHYAYLAMTTNGPRYLGKLTGRTA